MKVVTAHAVRSGDWWAVDVPEVPGVFTQARRLNHIPAMVADAVALMTGEQPKEIEVRVAPDVPAGEPSDVTIGWED